MMERHWNRRTSTLLFLVLAVLILAGITAAGIFLEEEAAVTDFSRTNLAPGGAFWFGTDWMGEICLQGPSQGSP